MRSRSTLSHALLLLVLASPLAATAQSTTTAGGKDELWEVTTKMEMPGMPMAMPAQTTRQCVAKSKGDEGYVPSRDNCRVTDTQRSGNRVTFKMTCTGKEAMDASGEIVFGSGSYDGRMQMAMKAEGQTMAMTNTFSGRRVGDCTAK